MEKVDLIILGAGPGGYVAAERAAAAGLRVVLVEERRLGGVCLNAGCIPSKTLLNSAKMFRYARHGAAYGAHADGVRFDLAIAMNRKRKVIETLRSGIAGLMKKHKVTVVQGRGRIEGHAVVVADRNIEADNILIATGSAPARPPIPGLDRSGVLDSTGILNEEALPERLVIIGGGIIGCEFACFFASLGVPVAVIEMLPEICPTLDPDVASLLRQDLAKLGVEFHLGAKVEAIESDSVVFQCGADCGSIPWTRILVATGRVPNVSDLGLEQAGMDFDRRGIKVDDRCATNVPGFWAVGDVTGRGWLAHSASRMGEVVVANLLGRRDRMRFDAIPSVVYTTPEVASVGVTESEAQARGMDIVTGKFPLQANGRFLAEHEGEKGLVKAIIEKTSRRLVGVHQIGGACSESIWGAAAAIEAELRVEELKEIVFPHPTTSEALRDALWTLK